MNSYSKFGIFVFLLFAYCASAQGQRIAVSKVAVKNGKRYESTNLIKLSDDTWKIEEDGSEYGITGIDTMIGKDVVLHTKDNLYLQVELVNSQDSLLLFDMTTRPKLGKSQYSYGVYEVHEYRKGIILENAFLTGFEYSTTGKPQYRYVVHSGSTIASKLQPTLLWTREDFYFDAWGFGMILTLRPKPIDGELKHYLLKFRSSEQRTKWIHSHPGRCYSSDLDYPKEVFYHFDPLAKREHK